MSNNYVYSNSEPYNSFRSSTVETCLKDHLYPISFKPTSLIVSCLLFDFDLCMSVCFQGSASIITEPCVHGGVWPNKSRVCVIVGECCAE